MLSYQAMPTSEKWRHDSSVTLAVRQRDVVLVNIDQLIDQFHRERDGFTKLSVACQLFFSLDYWLKVYKDDRSMEKGRAAAVEALYKFVAATYLCDALKCTINALPRELELLFGRELTGHGRVMDAVDGAAKYLSRVQASKYKLVFKHGKAYQYPWWNRGAPRYELQLADSRHAASDAHPGDRRAHLFKDFGFFAMSMSRDLYMAKHYAATDPVFDPVPNPDGNQDLIMLKRKGIYHSSYLSGVAVMFAGSMLIEAGVIKAIRSDSGHYQPADVNTVALLQTLMMYGVPINQIVIWTYDGHMDDPATLFLGDRGDWMKILEQRGRNMKDYRAAARYLEIEKYRREKKVSLEDAKKYFEHLYTVKVGGQRIAVKRLDPPKNPPVAQEPDPGFDLE